MRKGFNEAIIGNVGCFHVHFKEHLSWNNSLKFVLHVWSGFMNQWLVYQKKLYLKCTKGSSYRILYWLSVKKVGIGLLRFIAVQRINSRTEGFLKPCLYVEYVIQCYYGMHVAQDVFVGPYSKFLWLSREALIVKSARQDLLPHLQDSSFLLRPSFT